jgi:hypothetical protein
VKEPKRGRIVSIGDAIELVLKQNGIRRGDPQHRVFEAWNQAAGPLAKRAIPVRFHEGELIVFVESSAHYHELNNFTGPALMRATNRSLGSELIQRIVFKLKR